MATPVKTVQFRKAADVVTAYEQMALPTFAIWCGTELQFPFEPETVDEGAGYLRELLIKLKQSAAIYTLRIYKGSISEEVDSKTPYRCSFNFQLRRVGEEYIDGGDSPGHSSGGSDPVLAEQVRNLTLAVEALAAGREEDEEENKLGMVGTILAHDKLGPLVTGLLSNMINGAPKEPGKLNGVPGEDSTLLDQALVILKAHDPALGQHLYKLAQIAESKPDVFKMILSNLSMM